MNNKSNTRNFRRVTSVGVLCIALLGSVVFLTGCGAGFNPEMTDGLIDKRHESKATLVFREYKSSIYIVEIEGKRYLHNTAGGIIPLE
jgi:hypothetical protein